jgi:DNA-binding response OmpR family regulator
MNVEKQRIVAIDDEQDILDLIEITLSPHYEVITIRDPEVAVDQLEHIDADLIVLDVMMPKITGYQIIEKVRANPKLAHTLVVFLSAKDSNHDMKYGYKLGANLYLPKPFQPDRLLKTVTSLLEHVPHHPKLLTLRDIEMRVKHKVHYTGVPDTLTVMENPVPQAKMDSANVDDKPSSSFRLKRLLGKEHQEIVKRREKDYLPKDES